MLEDKKDLKIQVLLNKNIELSNENADLRVELHYATSRANELQRNLDELAAQEAQTDTNPAD